MALVKIHSPFPPTQKPYNHRHLHLLARPRPNLSIKSQKPTDTDDPLSPPPPPAKKPTVAAGQGFGSSSPSSSVSASTSKPSPSKFNSKKQKGKSERASIIRRSPVEKPAFISSEVDADKAKERSRNESAFLLAWLGFGAIILVEGILLAASGFLPEEWDNFFVKYLYPSFTPTVFLFVAGTVAYGVLKYLQNEQLKDPK